ncbi:MFS transporter [Salipiger sp.]|uniref:MFS transporter n=1 Tax=Salipiger sp. TaxID=2078585 RepID=UPI003A975D39
MTATPEPRGRKVFPALANRVFAAYAAGSFAAFTAIWVQRTVMGWLTWELTGSGSWLGVIAFAYLIPLVVVGPFGGALADRIDNMRVITGCLGVMAVAAVLLTALSAFGALTIWLLVAISAVQGVTEAFSQPAQLSLVPSLVPRRDLASAVATTSVSFNTARFIGPAVGGGLIAATGPATAFAVAACGFVLFLAVLLILHGRVETATRERSGHFLGALAEGVRYTVGHPGVGPLMLLVIAVGGLGRPVVELFPGFAEQVFRSDARGLAVLTSSVGIGAVLAGLRWSGANTGVDLARAMLRTSVGAVIALWAFLMAPSLAVAAPILVCLGFCTASTGITVQTMINLAVEDGFRGRVLSLFGVCFRGSPAIGALAMGGLADHFGLKLPVLGGGALLLHCWLALRHRVAGLSGALRRK